MTARDPGFLVGGGSPDVEEVMDHELSEPFAALVAEYETAVDDRDRFLWKWLDYLVPQTTLSCVDPEHRAHVRQAKLVATMFVVLLDDLAEKRRDRPTFERAMTIPFAHASVRPDVPEIDAEYLRFVDRVWTRFEAALADAPRADEFEDILTYDVKRNLDAIDYSSIANENLDLVSLEEATRYEGHNMMLLTYADVDLMYSTGFDRSEFATLRRVVLDAQEMMRIGNWIATWEREVAEGDFTSGVLVLALENDIITPEDLYEVRERTDDDAHHWLVHRIRESDVERHFVERYRVLDAEMSEFDPELRTVDIDGYLGGIEKAMGYYLGTRGKL